MIFKRTVMTSVFCSGLTALLVTSCGSNKKDDSTPAAPTAPTSPTATAAPASPTAPTTPVAQSTNPVSPPQQSPTPAAITPENLVTEITNASAISSNPVQPGQALQAIFKLRDAAQLNAAVSYQCQVHPQNAGAGSGGYVPCLSPFSQIVSTPGQYTLQVQALAQGGAIVGAPTMVSFNVGTVAQPGNGPQGAIGQTTQNYPIQIGQMYNIVVPAGFHEVYRSSTLTGNLTFEFVDGGAAADVAAPFATSCQQINNMTLNSAVSVPRFNVPYCQMTPPMSPLAGNRQGSLFQFLTNNMISFNGVEIASDNSLTAQSGTPVTRMFINTFSGAAPANNPYAAWFASDLGTTVSHLQLACSQGTPIQYIGPAPVDQGFFMGTIGSIAPMFGCSVLRDNQWYLIFGMLPVSHNSIDPSKGWGPWMGQSFHGVNAAEIVVESPAGAYQPAASAFNAQDAQRLMFSTLHQLLPTAGVCPIGAPCH